jgi:hypothetical protein
MPELGSTYKLMQTFMMILTNSSITRYEWPWSYYIAWLNGCVDDESRISSRHERR